jgi:hypothetical protein
LIEYQIFNRQTGNRIDIPFGVSGTEPSFSLPQCGIAIHLSFTRAPEAPPTVASTSWNPNTYFFGQISGIDEDFSGIGVAASALILNTRSWQDF